MNNLCDRCKSHHAYKDILLCAQCVGDISATARPNAYERDLLQAELDRWRRWAQFVYLGGGPVTLGDDALRAAVCATHDKSNRACLTCCGTGIVTDISFRVFVNKHCPACGGTGRERP